MKKQTFQVFPFEKDIVGKNFHSVYTLCLECGTWGINMPLEKECGNCGYSDGKTYYDAETINSYLCELMESKNQNRRSNRGCRQKK